MSIKSKNNSRLTEQELAEVKVTRLAARARFAHLADNDDEDEEVGVVDPDNPPMTDEHLARLRPAAEMVPALVAATLRRKGGRPRLPAPKIAISIRLDPDLVEALRSSGDGWQGRVNDVLRQAFGFSDGRDVAETVRTTAKVKTLVSGDRPRAGGSGRRYGRVRVHGGVVSTDVSDGITLRSETVSVDRRPVERIIEMKEISEEAMIANPAGYVKEIRSDMEVIGSDGAFVGTVDRVEGDRLRLRAADAGRQHHYLPRAMVKSVDSRVTLAVTADEAEAGWATT
jgi:uncharacterized protein (DUF4415 family)